MRRMNKFTLTPEFERAISLFKQGKHLIIAGAGGTGKTELLKQLRLVAQSQLKYEATCAPTGIAARNVDGDTINSLFGLPSYLENPQQTIQINSYVASRLSKLDVLFVDEASMINALTFDIMNKKLQYARISNEPFGGVQVVLFCDIFQLPPVLDSDDRFLLLNVCKYNSVFFFDADIYKQAQFHFIELTHIFRQNEIEFKNTLNRIRRCRANKDDVNFLNSRVGNCEHDALILATNNVTVDKYNAICIDSIREKQYLYEASITGNFKESDCPTSFLLNLKIGTPVMIVANITDAQGVSAVNGDIGKIYCLTDEVITVELLNGDVIDIEPFCWTKYKLQVVGNTWENKVTGTCTQFPITIAASITIHKSQGLSLDKVFIDLKNIFAQGQLYVGLSRVRRLVGLTLSRPLTLQEINKFAHWNDMRIINNWYDNSK